MISSVVSPAIGASSLSKRPSLVARRGLLVAARRELVELGAGQPPLGGDQFGADALRHQTFGVALGHRAERVAAGQHAGAHRHPRHRLDAGGDHDVVGARDHALGGEADGLLAAAALPVDGRAGHASRGIPAPSSALRAMLTAWSPTWVTAPAMTSSTSAGSIPVRSDHLAQAVGEQVDGQHVVQRAAGLALADRVCVPLRR